MEINSPSKRIYLKNTRSRTVSDGSTYLYTDLISIDDEFYIAYYNSYENLSIETSLSKKLITDLLEHDLIYVQMDNNTLNDAHYTDKIHIPDLHRYHEEYVLITEDEFLLSKIE